MSEFDKQHAVDAYPEGIEHGFWSIARNRLIDKTLREAAKAGLRRASGPILEIGCGPGIVVAAMRQKGHEIWGVELGKPQIRNAAEPFVTTGVQAQDLEQGFRESIETIMLLDVIEHIEDDVGFLSSMISAFPRCRCVLVTVPARQEIWSNYDEYYGHYRRYTIQTLNQSLEGASLKPQKTKYFFRSLYLAAWFIKALGRKRQTSLRAPSHSMRQIHRAIALGYSLEDRLLGPLPLPGLSLLSVASLPDR